MTYDLARFDSAATTHCGAGLRAAAADAASMEGAARATCRHLHAELRGPAGAAALMVRCYRTQSFGTLPPDLQRVAKRALGLVAFSPPDPAMKCLVMLASAGDEPDWNDRRTSRGHQAIPLPSPHIVERAPMIAQLIEELGFDLEQVVRSATSSQRTDAYGIFHVETAAGSPFIPAQDFVSRYAVRSVLGFGGALAGGDIFAGIIFSRAHIPVATANRFRTLARDLGTCLESHAAPVFDAAPPDGAPAS